MTEIEFIGWIVVTALLSTTVTWSYAERVHRRHDKSAGHEVTGILPIPTLTAADDHRIDADDVRAAAWLLAWQASELAAQMHAVAVERLIAQVVADEVASVDLDDLLREAS